MCKKQTEFQGLHLKYYYIIYDDSWQLLMTLLYNDFIISCLQQTATVMCYPYMCVWTLCFATYFRSDICDSFMNATGNQKDDTIQ